MGAISRATDPATSHLAAEQIEATGSAATHRALILAEVRRYPGTYTELASRVGLEKHAAMKRLNDLERAGLVRKGTPRRCNVTDSRCSEWIAT